MRYPIGTKARLTNHGKHRMLKWPEGVWAETGTILTLIEYHPPLADLDGWYTAEIVPGAVIALGDEFEGDSWEATDATNR